ncbi:MAG: T9SS type A sorting domain-containing protein [Candidatus Kapabacteria bacterium]|nr:T9SS type A sorting domain-containing protein [Candidatus Kapabacteria bacterium]
MKVKIIIGILMLASFAFCYAEEQMIVYMKDGQKKEYKLTDIRKLTFDKTSDVESNIVIPLIFKPNPFESLTSIDIETTSQNEIEINIYRLNGVLAYTQKVIPTNTITTFTWNGIDLSSNKAEEGIYNVEVTSQEKKQFAKIILIRK